MSSPPQQQSQQQAKDRNRRDADQNRIWRQAVSLLVRSAFSAWELVEKVQVECDR